MKTLVDGQGMVYIVDGINAFMLHPVPIEMRENAIDVLVRANSISIPFEGVIVT